ncbi:histidine phosphatase family protein [Sansalvadorimonas sp. 2012CJ34-2]|uniref:Histidine phosphatase family protein n=1 Tax=Parendozoicomonas callyspongiae TaxID=2942213 RepID=A0ABT0PFG3_9GAMM|nr:histidine phosphatase family protein [Sansalvadorimonas sp. 2012CJ34-2]MCL6269278.1 histidine phosphatase family protein [Sansalvadorimonas sp. 2012CJ34-2]
MLLFGARWWKLLGLGLSLVGSSFQAYGEAEVPNGHDSRHIVVIRHGQSVANVSKRYNTNPANNGYFPAPLTDIGREQAAATAADLHDTGYNTDNIAAIFCSPLPRTIETAEIIASRLGVDKDKIVILESLIERNLGEREGMYHDQFDEKDSWNPENPEHFHGETNDQVKARMQVSWAKALSWPEPGHIIMVGHGQPIQALTEYLTGRGKRFANAEFIQFNTDGSQVEIKQSQLEAAISR